MINSDEETICYDLTTTGVTPPYERPAKTATHIHEAVVGQAGPPRLAFPNPEGDGEIRTSSGCVEGPFTTGVEGEDGKDTAEGFTLSMIETNPANFFGDTPTEEFVPGAVRGQLTPMPVGGVETDQGGLATGGTSLVALGAGAGPAPAPAAPPTTNSPAPPPEPTVEAPEAAEPTSVQIPRIDLDQPIEGFGLDEGSRLLVPEDAGQVAWFDGGGRPGGSGPTVIYGHVDSRKGPAVFARLASSRSETRST